MSSKIQGVRGMNDLVPKDIGTWHIVESTLRKIGWQYGYQEIRTPMLEKTMLFKQSIGDQTDIVEKEMYTFTDSGEESLSLRPEATASTVRACIQHGLLYNTSQRLWYMGPMFRRERPQKGRFRQFHQFGIEAFGWSGPDIDSEIIRVGERIWRDLGVEGISLQINTLGSDASRAGYRDSLKNYFMDFVGQLDEDSIRRLERNPLRILDSKVKETIRIVEGAPSILDCLSDGERSHFDGICHSLEASGIRFSINPKLVRGLDYYTSTVFEWVTDQLGSQSAVCAGGRYDSLVANRGGKNTPAIGFAMGMERLIELVNMQGNHKPGEQNLVYMIDTNDDISESVMIAELLRNAGYRVISHCGGGKMKSQLKKADQSGAAVAMIIGESEKQLGVVQVKKLRETSPQTEVPGDQLVSWCEQNI
jgi:histidyl-tRNA synthetase